MANKEVKKYRFNYVMTETERESLNILFEHHKKKCGYCSTIGSIMRKLVADEVKRIQNTP